MKRNHANKNYYLGLLLQSCGYILKKKNYNKEKNNRSSFLIIFQVEHKHICH